METIIRLSDWIYVLLNGLAGRSWLLDTLITLPLDNDLVKAGPIGACFVYAWWSSRDEAELRRRRATLLVTIASLLFVMATTKTIGDHVFQPRPFVHAEQAWHLEDGKLVESDIIPYRQPLAGQVRARTDSLKRGEIDSNDLVSFPSDHAGFFVALSLGIFFASRRAGSIALAWTAAIVLLPRIVTGMHSPLDIAAGAGIGAGFLLAVQFAARQIPRRAPRSDRRLDRPARGAGGGPALLRHRRIGRDVLGDARDLAGTGVDIIEYVAGA